ncbi:MAG: hypothetical protein KA248_11025 [Kiritimatiellae bacterium]|nr:hypothetical protein [Kiritimatiellia bacterium]
MIAKTPLGVPFFDAAYGGVYQGRSTLVTGRTNTGKTVMAFQFLRQGLQQDERCLMLSTRQAADLTICADSLGLPISNAVEAENLILLEYSDFVFGMDRTDAVNLPADGFNQLKEVIETHSIRRVVIDTIVPWVAIQDVEHLGQYALSFARAFDRLGTTTLMTLPKPVSAMAHRLRKILEEIIPICIYLNPSEKSDRLLFQVTKYLGEKKPGPPIEYDIVNGLGLTELSAEPPPPAAPAAGPAAAARKMTPSRPSMPAGGEAPSGPRINFSSVMPGLRTDEIPRGPGGQGEPPGR